ncbi:uncharacterized protein JCM15063_001804 [Sporobolomyces koalae]|uniref:uncharacterized protein n=1 Tax=Sporobolomyces koalae TaxID=500713 RepID=UPI003173B363
MADAANLLSILRGELPVPPLDEAPAAPHQQPARSEARSTQAGTMPSFATAVPLAGSRDGAHLDQALNRFAQPAPPAPPAPIASGLAGSTPGPTRLDQLDRTQSSKSLLSILKGHSAGLPTSDHSLLSLSSQLHPSPSAAEQPTMSSTTTATAPNFTFVSPFDLLNSARAAPKPLASRPPESPLSRPSSSSQPNCFPTSAALDANSNFPLQYLTQPLLAPASRANDAGRSFDPTTPQHVSISVASGTHCDSIASGSPDLTPITLFSVQAQTREPETLRAARKLAISTRSIAYAVQPSIKSKKPKTGVRIIDRDTGARVLIERPFDGITSDPATAKKHDQEVVHLEFAKTTDRGDGTRSLVLVGTNGVAAIWRGQDGFEDQLGRDAAYAPDLIIHPPANSRFILAKLHPSQPIVALCTSEGTVALLNVESSARQAQKVVVALDELNEVTRYRQLEGIVDAAFSPDGSLLAVVDRLGFSVHSTSPSSPTTSALYSSQLPLSLRADGPSEIAFLSSVQHASRPVVFGLAISGKSGARIACTPFVQSSDDASVTIELEAPAKPEEQLYHHSQLQVHPSSTTLFVSSSLRGSIFSFKIAGPPSESVDGLDSEVLSRLLRSTAGPDASRSMHISHMLETPHTSPVLQFVLDTNPLQRSETRLPTDATPERPYRFGGPPVSPHGTGAEIQTIEPQIGALVLHPQGIQHIALGQITAVPSIPSAPQSALVPIDKESASGPPPPTNGRPALETAPPDEMTHDESSSELERYLATGRRMSLEGSIHVSSEVEIEEERVDPVSWEYMRRASVPIPYEREFVADKVDCQNQITEEAEVGVPKSTAIERDSPDETVKSGTTSTLALDTATSVPDTTCGLEEDEAKEIKLAGPVVNAAIRSMKAAAKKNTKEPFSNTHKNYSHSSSPGRSDLQEATSSNLPGTASPQQQQQLQSSTSTLADEKDAAVLEGLQRLETALPESIGALVGQALEKYLQRFEEERLEDRALNKAREETLLKLVSQSVVKGTGRALDSAFKSSILPAVQQAVNSEVQQTLDSAVRKILPREISSVVLDPDFTRSLAASLTPVVNETITELVLSGLVPSFKHTLRKSVDEIMSEMKREMVGVRKEIVREQSGTVEKLEQEVLGLRQELGEMRGLMERMERLLVAFDTGKKRALPRTPSAALSPMSAVPSAARPLPPPSSTADWISKADWLSPPPAAGTVPSTDYEDMMTNFLQPAESPYFGSLLAFLGQASLEWLDRIFPHSTSGHPPALSPPVALSLAYRISEFISKGSGTLAVFEKEWLEWLRRALGACDVQQPAGFVEMAPRILTRIIEKLVERGTQLQSVNDHQGAGEVRVVEQYARARLSLFQ